MCIRDRLDEVYGRDITQYSHQGKVWAESMSWVERKRDWLEALSK